MSAIDRRTAHSNISISVPGAPEIRAEDPRVTRTRTAVRNAARTLFLRNGYAGTTMEDIAELAGLTKRTLYNNYADKDALFVEIVAEISGTAATFARSVHEDVLREISTDTLRVKLLELGERLARAIVREEVIALRRLLIGEGRSFPDLAREYYDRAPGAVIEALTTTFRRLNELGILDADDAKLAASQFAYLLIGEPLDRAILTGQLPEESHVIRHARDGVETFLARYAPRSRRALGQ